MKYIVIERYADNGEFSHYDLINTENGETAITDIDETLQLRQCAVSRQSEQLFCDRVNEYNSNRCINCGAKAGQPCERAK